MMRDPEKMTPEEVRTMQVDVDARIVVAQRLLESPRHAERARRELDELDELKQEIDEWE